MEISSNSSNGYPWQAFISSLLEDWREEAIPERDGLLGETSGDNVRHVIVRAAFLDYFFGNDMIKDTVKDWVERTPLKERAQRMSRAILRLADLEDIPWHQIGWDEHTGIRAACGPDDTLVTQAVEEANSSLQSFLLELRSFPESGILRIVVGEAVKLLESLDLLHQWLAIELMQVYFANLLVNDFSWRYTDKLDVEPATVLAAEITYEFSTQVDETVWQAISRIRQEVEWAIEKLGRYQQPLPRGSLPGLTRSTLKRNARWFYLHRVAGRSIRSIAQEEFAGDGDRRKDVRDGITRARELLDLGRRENSYAYEPGRPVWRPEAGSSNGYGG
ncbi:MAG: hypothetical protein V3W08_10590 [Candidatus Binatia bacterium]